MKTFILNQKELLNISDESFNAGASAVIKIIEKSLDNWKFRLLFMITPKHCIQQIKKGLK